MACLNWWREQCIAWCYDRVEDGKFADQGYLDDWPARFNCVRVLDNPGVNLAPWNVKDVKLSISKGKVYANGSLLVFYHFHALKLISPRLFNPSWENYTISPSLILRFYVYQPYILSLSKINRKIDSTMRLEFGLRDHMPSWVRNRTWFSTILAVLTGRLFFRYHR